MIRHFGQLFKKTFQKWNGLDPMRQSATAYYAVFSLPALLVIVVAVAGFFFEKDKVVGSIFDQMSAIMGSNTAESIKEMIAKSGETGHTWLATSIGIVTLLFGATGVFAELQKTLNVIWEVKIPATKIKSGILRFLRIRIFSFGLILSIGFLLLISLVISTLLGAASNYIKARWPDVFLYVFYVLNFVISLGIITVLFALMFRFLPDAKASWRHIWLGAALTALLFTLGKFGLGLYFGKAKPESTYGAAGSIVLILLWVAYSSAMLFFGACFTRVLEESKIKI